MRRFRVGQLVTAAVLAAAVPLVASSAPALSPRVPARARADAAAGGLDPTAATLVQPASAGRFAHVELRDVGGRAVAWVDLVRLDDRVVLVTVRAAGLTPGFHGIHLHARGVCDPAGATPFAGAGPHLNPTGDAEGMQAGAFPVLLVAPDGSGYAAFTDGNFALDQLVGPDGTSVVIHAGPDNYANIPARYRADGVPGPDAATLATGDAGGRVACGVVSEPGTGHFVQGWRSHAWT
jgi:Cu-Zn family superoxide dismutase